MARSFTVALAGAGALAVLGAHAEIPPAHAREAAREVEEVRVTARKKDELLSDVPISISVVSGEEIERQGYRDLQALAAALPGVNLSKAGSRELMNVRGVGSAENPGFEQSVGLVVDGVAIGRSRAARAGLFDVARVEVLKGPQTTYFGANTIAGVLHVASRNPVLGEEAGGHLRASYEMEAGEAVLEGAWNLPASDDWALRVAGKWTDSGGYIDDVGLGRRVPAIQDKLARLTMLWAPREAFTAQLKLTRGALEANGGLDMQIVNCEPFAPAAAGRGARGGMAQFDCLEANGQFMEDDLNYTRSTDLPASRSLDIDVSTLSWEYDVGPNRLTAVTGYYRFQNDFAMDLDLSAVPSAIAPSRFSVAQVDDAHGFSQELRLSSAPAGEQGRRWEWTAGLYYQREDALVYNSVVTGFTPPLPAGAARVTGARNAQQGDTWSAFGTVLLRATDRLDVGFGLRYISVEKTLRQSPTVLGVMPADRVANARRFQPLVPFAFAHHRRTDGDLLPSIDVQFAWTDRANAYVSFRQGFKAGGYSLANPPPGMTTDYLQTFDPETVNAYELGLKATFLQNRLNANLAVFRSDFKDRQVSSFSGSSQGGNAGLTQQVANAASSRTQGMELHLRARMTDRVTLLGDLTLLDSQYRRFTNAPCFNAQSPAQGCVNGAQDLSGRPTTFAPKYVGSFALWYEHPMRGGRLTVAPNLYFTDGYGIVSDFSPGTIHRAFTKANLRVAFASLSGHWEVALAGRNLTGEITSHFCQEAATVATASTVSCAVDPPASVALQARYDF